MNSTSCLHFSLEWSLLYQSERLNVALWLKAKTWCHRWCHVTFKCVWITTEKLDLPELDPDDPKQTRCCWNNLESLTATHRRRDPGVAPPLPGPSHLSKKGFFSVCWWHHHSTILNVRPMNPAGETEGGDGKQHGCKAEAEPPSFYCW